MPRRMVSSKISPSLGSLQSQKWMWYMRLGSKCRTSSGVVSPPTNRWKKSMTVPKLSRPTAWISFCVDRREWIGDQPTGSNWKRTPYFAPMSQIRAIFLAVSSIPSSSGRPSRANSGTSWMQSHPSCCAIADSFSVSASISRTASSSVRSTCAISLMLMIFMLYWFSRSVTSLHGFPEDR